MPSLIAAAAHLTTHEDPEVLRDALWALSHASDGDDTRIDARIL